MDALIRVTGLYRHFGAYCALNDVTFELYPGEVLGLLGPNGAGKSTTLRIVSGCLAASAGRVSIDGRDLRDHPRQAKRRLGYLPENPPLYPELKVDEYLGFCARLRSVPLSQIDGAVLRAKLRTGLMSSGARLIAQLSKGYRQRVGIAQAIIHDPRVIILDEPTSGLDPNQLAEIRDLIRELGRNHGVILSTHILPEVQSVCSRVMIMHEGSLVYCDSLGGGQDEKETQLWVGLSRAPAPAELEALPGVERVLEQHGARFKLLTRNDCRPEVLAKQIVDSGWGMYEFTPAQQGLEQIFAQLTTGEAST